MKFVFCSDSLDHRTPDEAYAAEVAAVERLGAEHFQLNFEALTDDGNAAKAVRRVPEQSPSDVAIYRGWMLKPHSYLGLTVKPCAVPCAARTITVSFVGNAKNPTKSSSDKATDMGNINTPKRSAYRRRLLALLSDILSDPSVMPNADCCDIVVVVRDVAFGKTVREIYVDFRGFWKNPELACTAHTRYMEEAKAAGQKTYADLTDVAIFPALMERVEEEVQRRLGLRYRPRIRPLTDLGQDHRKRRCRGDPQ